MTSKRKFFLVLSVTASMWFGHDVVAGAFPNPALWKNPYAISGAVSDAVKYSLVKYFNRESEFFKVGLTPNYGMLRLCHSDELKQLSPVLLNQQCRAAIYEKVESCEDSDGCINIRIHPSLKQDPIIWGIITKAAINPCGHIPIIADNLPDIHWEGFSHPAKSARVILHCKNGKLPYRKALLKAGEEVYSFQVK